MGHIVLYFFSLNSGLSLPANVFTTASRNGRCLYFCNSIVNRPSLETFLQCPHLFPSINRHPITDPNSMHWRGGSGFRMPHSNLSIQPNKDIIITRSYFGKIQEKQFVWGKRTQSINKLTHINRFHCRRSTL